MIKRIIYAGTPEFAEVPLRALLEHADYGKTFEVVAVYTQPDRPAGRGRVLQASPVKKCAREFDLPVLQPPNFKDDADFAVFEAFNADIMIVAAYGVLLPERVLVSPIYGCVNLHASLLPRWRGAAPIQRAIEMGDERTGITLMQMDKGLDTGAMLATSCTPISDHDTAHILHDRLAGIGADLLIKELPVLLEGASCPEAQNDAYATYAKKLTKTEADINWRDSAQQIARTVRAMNPWPVCFSHSDVPKLATLRVWQAEPIPTRNTEKAAGTVLACGKHGIDVQTGDGVLRITCIQASGGKALNAEQFTHAHDVTGVVLRRAHGADT